jgi:hypothetical protein
MCVHEQIGKSHRRTHFIADFPWYSMRASAFSQSALEYRTRVLRRRIDTLQIPPAESRSLTRTMAG